MDRTIHYFHDGINIWIVRSTIPRVGLIMHRTIQYFQDRTDIWIVRFNISRIIGRSEIPDNLIFSKVRDPGCRGSIRLVKTVCLNQFSDFSIIKNGPKSNFYIKFDRKSLNSIGWAGFIYFLPHMLRRKKRLRSPASLWMP